jgi:hypothetical protein
MAASKEMTVETGEGHREHVGKGGENAAEAARLVVNASWIYYPL